MAFTTAALLAGTAISTFSVIEQGRAASDAAKTQGEMALAQGRAAEEQGDFQAKIAARNADQAIKEAEGKRQAASEAAIQIERQGRILKGRQTAGFAKSGVELRGSPLSVLIETAQDTEADRLTVLREGAIAGASDEFRAGILTAQGRAAKARGRTSAAFGRAGRLSARARGSAAKRASVLSATGTGLSGLGRSLPSLIQDTAKPPSSFVPTGK